jgi:hypothetical protein
MNLILRTSTKVFGFDTAIVRYWEGTLKPNLSPLVNIRKALDLVLDKSGRTPIQKSVTEGSISYWVNVQRLLIVRIIYVVVPTGRLIFLMER